jgi:hypothetical protein
VPLGETESAMVRVKVLLGGATVAFVFFASTGAPLAAVTKPPGLLRTSDLSGSFAVIGAPTAFTAPGGTLVVDPTACTEIGQVDAQSVGTGSIAFLRVGAPPGGISLIELVTLFPNAKAAAASFRERVKSHAARIKCGTVGFIQALGASPSGTTKYSTVKFPKIGSSSYLEIVGDPTTTSSEVSEKFVSGPYIVALNTFGGSLPPSIKELKTIAKRAVKRLPIPTAIPPTTST